MTVEEAWAECQARPDMWAWVQSRPPVVRALIERMPMGTWWRHKPHVCKDYAIYTPYSYSEDGTVTLHKRDAFLPVPLGVFGCHPDDFEWVPYDEHTPLEVLMDEL